MEGNFLDKVRLGQINWAVSSKTFSRLPFKKNLPEKMSIHSLYTSFLTIIVLKKRKQIKSFRVELNCLMVLLY